MDEDGRVQEDNINWDAPFNELATTIPDPKLTPEMHQALEKFVAFHVNPAALKETAQKGSKRWNIQD